MNMCLSMVLFFCTKSCLSSCNHKNHDLINDIFYTVAYGSLTNKSMESYIEFLEQI